MPYSNKDLGLNPPSDPAPPGTGFSRFPTPWMGYVEKKGSIGGMLLFECTIITSLFMSHPDFVCVCVGGDNKSLLERLTAF